MDSSASFGDQHDSHDEEPEVNPGFIEALGQSMGFVEADEEYRRGLYTFPKVCRVRMPC
jgi:hypothetical protein